MFQGNGLNRRGLLRGALATGVTGIAFSKAIMADDANLSHVHCVEPGLNKVSKLKKILHVGVFTDDLDRALVKYSALGMSCSVIVESEKMGVKIALLTAGSSALEVVQITKPTQANDALAKVVLGQEGVINHVCFEVDDLAESISEFEGSGAKLVEGCPTAGVQGNIAFFYPETTEGVLIELCQLSNLPEAAP
ncbi:VOC family protein [Aestuariicella sp. G3-2]|uniref:VOC family protein n=1 Tax=Pseudomaricurvus albidus TaxID=2842452 RepID=UPI001C0E6A02|nr:VOC family protein [Aestuariicella albida]MBU3069198.1 VOC family protein [Aestuariicella albida]